MIDEASMKLDEVIAQIQVSTPEKISINNHVYL